MRHILQQLLLLLIACAPSLRAESLQSDSLAVSPPPTTRTVSGMVVDDTGESVIGATITAKGKPKIAAVSDVEGRFNLSGLRDGDVLQVSYLGFKTIDIPLKRDRNFYKIMLHGNVSQLDEVVVVGYATQKKADLTGAVSSVNINALEDRPLTNATNALAGLAAGLTVSNSGGNTPGYEAQSILVRGQGTLNNAAPLVVVDGMTGIALSDINPGDIENISILKDAASSAIYGSRAANGVILVTTRQGSEQAPRVTYSGNVSFETVAKRLNLVTNYADFMEIQNAGLIVNGQASRFSQGKIDEWRNDAGRNPTIYPNTDWQDHIYRNPSVVQTHNLSVTGGSKTVRYNLSAGYVDNPGMIYYTDYKRYQLRSNIEVN
ncbi:MAG: SusC/RagA family TonB-linked outer membrane protein, partial [Duncaniella sp.]|nr:SusC/RagA family TonB-linked outer membrane protein [Duncaniella sp.]